MKRKREHKPRPADQQPERVDEIEGRIFERPDGFYWRRAGGAEYGPFTTLAEAESDMESNSAPESAEPAETLQEAESELGMSEWIDPDTGAPAEDSVPRIEDH